MAECLFVLSVMIAVSVAIVLLTACDYYRRHPEEIRTWDDEQEEE